MVVPRRFISRCRAPGGIAGVWDPFRWHEKATYFVQRGLCVPDFLGEPADACDFDFDWVVGFDGGGDTIGWFVALGFVSAE